MQISATKRLSVIALSIIFLFFSVCSFAQNHGHEPKAKDGAANEHKKEGFNAAEVIFGHVLDGHDFHFFDIGDKPIGFPLPVILYSPQKGFSTFMSSKFEHGHKTHNNYALLNKHSLAEMGLDPKKYFVGQIIPITDDGKLDETTKVFDISLTRNVVQMLVALALLVFIMLRIAKKYKNGLGVTTAPKGSQGLIEPVITFVRDEVAKPNLGNKYEKYLPFLLTIFFFILINNIFGLVPGSANVTGNIAFTLVLGLIAFIVILFSSNKHYWGPYF